jgi:DNA-binding CsgD family transcriptional regulator
VVALHCGELDVAEPVLQRAVSAGTGGVLFAARHRLLLGWLAMVRGRTTVAREHLAAANKTGHPLEPRDWLFAVGLEVGLARRDSDVRALRDTWARACEAVLRHPVDLFTLLPLGEFAIASARLRDQGRLVPHLREASALLAQLGNPALWATQVHWSGLHAAIIAEQSDVAAEHVAALAADARRSRYGSVLATAADCWLAVLAGQVDPDRVQAAAQNLHGVGLSWDGARLAGQAAIRTADRRAMVGLLECARLLQGRPATSEASSPEKRVVAVEEPAGGRLSQREREVAGLVLDGLTYKQVGDRLFISAKTVEHHMARMRQRLGCSSRGELLAQLRVLTERS